MHNKIKFFVGCVLSLSLFLTGCGSSQKDAESSTPIPLFQRTHTPTQIISSAPNSLYAPQTTSFDFGTLSLTAPQEGEGGVQTRTMPFPIRGNFTAPQGKTDAPVVVIFHGSHNNEEEGIRYDIGFSYLAEALAKQGYAAVTLDLQNAYLWKYGDSQERQWISQMFPLFLDNLTEKFGTVADFQSLMLLGHSRGGEVIFDLYSDYPQVKALLPLAPTVGNALPDTADIPVSILASEWDGDVASWDGYVKFDVRNATQRNRDLYFTVLQSANHNYYNTRLENRNDATLLRESLEGQLTPQQQQDFLVQFTLDWCRKIFEGDTTNSLYHPTQSEPFALYGLPVGCKIALPSQGKQVLDLTKGTPVHTKVSLVTESYLFDQDELQGFQYPLMSLPDYDRSQIPLTQFSWEKEGSSVAYSLKDLSLAGVDRLVLQTAIDTPNPLNAKDKNQSFSLLLTDKNGAATEIVIDSSTPALQYVEGFLDETPLSDRTIRTWSTYTPTFTISIPATAWEGLETARLDTLQLVFDQTEKGSLVVEEIAFSKPQAE